MCTGTRAGVRRVAMCAAEIEWTIAVFLDNFTTGESQFQRRKPALVITLGSMGSPSSAAVRLARVLAIQRFLHCKQLLLNNLGSLACLHHYDKSSKLRARVSILSRTQSATHSRKRTLVGCFVPPIYAWGGGGPPPIMYGVEEDHHPSVSSRVSRAKTKPTWM